MSFAEWPPIWFRSKNLNKMDRHFANDIFKYIVVEEGVCILIHLSLDVVSNSLDDNKLALVQLKAHHQTGNKPTPESMMT